MCRKLFLHDEHRVYNEIIALDNVFFWNFTLVIRLHSSHCIFFLVDHFHTFLVILVTPMLEKGCRS